MHYFSDFKGILVVVRTHKHPPVLPEDHPEPHLVVWSHPEVISCFKELAEPNSFLNVLNRT